MKRNYSGFSQALFALFSMTVSLIGQTLPPPFPVKRIENADTWKRDGEAAIARAKILKPRKGKAKNVILFIGDGMGITTITASRIFEGQLRGESGEENQLSFEEFPYVALSKTYSVNQQTSESAPTMSAIMTGVKSVGRTLSVNQQVILGDYKSVAGNETTSLLELAEDRGLSTGIVTTTRLTHATPAACYSHTANRDWESDADVKRISQEAYDANFSDIARQFVEFKHGDGIEVAFGGGRSKFLPTTMSDPEYQKQTGSRLDGRNLTEEWRAKNPQADYVWNKKQFDAIDVKKTKHVLGLFEPSHMLYEYDRAKKVESEPTLTEMTTKAIDLLSKNRKGFFLMVEAGRIDHAHHAGNAFRALNDTVELSNAVRAASEKVNLDETLIIVTADHSHTLTIVGYPARGNNILGVVRENNSQGIPLDEAKPDGLGLPFTTLSYANGRGYQGETEKAPEGVKKFPSEPTKFKPLKNGRADLTNIDTTDPDYLQEATLPLKEETHGGEDVAIFATGAGAHVIHGVMEENWIFFAMKNALRWK